MPLASLATIPAEREPYTSCQELGHGESSMYGLEWSPREVHWHSLRSDAGPPVDSTGFDWNNYYWGHMRSGERDQRRTIIRPLPPSITDRIPIEVCERILDMLKGEELDLYK